jgi:hypothetical protein
MKRSQWAKWAAFPSFVFWLAIAVMIWLFLLGWARMVSGTFSPIEIAMTIAFAAASVIGMWKSVRSRTQVSWAAGIGVFVLFAFLQGLAFRISMLPRVAHDPW